MSIYPYLKRHKYEQEQHQILVFNQLETTISDQNLSGSGIQ